MMIPITGLSRMEQVMAMTSTYAPRTRRRTTTGRQFTISDNGDLVDRRCGCDGTVEAIKEQQKEIEFLKKEIQAIKVGK